MAGNARQFAADGTRQGNMEDGLFEVVIVKDARVRPDERHCA